MKRYEEYKPTGTKWIASIPATWDVQKIGALFSQRKEKVSDRDYAPISVTKNGILPQLETAAKTDDGDNRKKVCIGDFVINSRSDRKGSCGISALEGSVSLINIVLQPRDRLIGKYAHYLLRCQPFSEEYYRNGRGIVADLWTTRYSEMKTILLPVPPRAEQDQIVRYLDWQVSKINQLLAAKRKQIKLLNAQKHALVSHYVTRGLAENAPLKTSGVNWLSAIPAHWSIRKLRTLLTPYSEKNQPNLPLLSVVREKGVIVRNVEDTEENHNFIPDDLSGYKVVRKDQFVINKMKSWQGSYGIAPCDGIVSPAYFVFDIDFDNLEYFHYAIRSKIYVNFFAQASDGIRVGQWDLSIDKMKDIPFIIPPSNEQAEIVSRIKKEIVKTQEAISGVEKQISALEELRTRLISDVVTGQIDVRNIKVPDFEYVNEETIDDSIEEELEENEEE